LNRRFARCLTACLIALITFSVAHESSVAVTQPYRQFQRGMTYVVWWHDTYTTSESDRSLEALADTGANWVALIVTWYQEKYTDPTMNPDVERTPTDASLTHAIQMIHRLGMRIMLKPHVDLLESEHWRGEIQPPDEKAWFDGYQAFITHYAELAQSNDVEMLSIGTELNSMTKREYTARWLTMIDAVRRVYGGELTYAANWWPNSAWQDLGFLKELDYLGIDAYFPLTEKADPTISELEKTWQQWISQVEAWQKISGKQIVFTEIGYRDIEGANIKPWDWQTEGVEDQQEQANCYQATLAVLWEKPWLQGIFWWAWTYNRPARDYTPWGKLAEGMLRQWYAKPYIPHGTPSGTASALIDIQKAENATVVAIRQGRTRGLDQAKDLLSEAIQAYDQGDMSRSEALADSSVRAAHSAVSQKEYDLAAAVVNRALQKLSSLRNATLQSTDAIQLRQQSETQYTSALQALSSNEFDRAKVDANNASALAEKAFTVEHDFQAQETMLRQQQNPYQLVGFTIAGIFLASIALVAVRTRRRK